MQEVIGSTPIFSTEEVNEDKQAVMTLVVAACFVLYQCCYLTMRQNLQHSVAWTHQNKSGLE